MCCVMEGWLLGEERYMSYVAMERVLWNDLDFAYEVACALCLRKVCTT